MENSRVSPDDSCNFFSRITYAWIFPLLRLGYRRSLQMEDTYLLPNHYDTLTLTERFLRSWDEKTAASSPASLLSILMSSFGKRWGWAGILKFISDTCTLASPILLSLLLRIITDQTTWHFFTLSINTVSTACLLCLGIFLLLVIASFCVNYYFQIVSQEGLKIRTALNGAIYRKCFRLSGLSRQRFSSGRIVNLISTDTYRVETAAVYTHYIWSAAYQVAVILLLLYQYLGAACFAGFGILLLSIPFQTVFMKRLSKYRKQTAVLTDQRVKIFKEILQNMRVIKFYAWEDAFLERIYNIRACEMGRVKRTQLTKTAVFAVTSVLPIFACMVSFIIYNLNHSLTPVVVFPALALFNLLRVPLHLLPNVLSMVAEARVALPRIQEFLLADELTYHPKIDPSSPFSLTIQHATFEWESTTPSFSEMEEKPKVARGLIQDINLKIPSGSLVGICGAIGSGKSSLLSAIVGEMKHLSGDIILSSVNVGYCPQQAWMQNATLRDNIVFGRPFDEQKYRQVLYACALERDVDSLPQGDLTEIGEKGINLSGGQKQRISLARIVYSDPDIVLLDDPLSAVDEHVGRHIFEHCIQGALKSKTILLVTHQLYWLKKVDWIVVMSQGGIIESQGTWLDLTTSATNASTAPSFLYEWAKQLQSGKVSITKLSATDAAVKNEQQRDEDATHPLRANKAALSTPLMTAEERSTGAVPFSVYREWIKLSGGYPFAIAAIVSLSFVQAVRIYTDFWLSEWTSSNDTMPSSTRLIVYVCLGGSQAIINFLSGAIFCMGGVASARRLFSLALKSVIKSPIIFFDTTPLGRILNRFSKDQDAVDASLPDSFRTFGTTLAMTISTFVLICIVTPVFIAPLLPLLLLYFYIQQFYRYTSRELKRLDSLCRSPLYAQFSETLTGLSTIRASHDQDRFISRNQLLADSNNRPYYLQLTAQRWLGLNLEMIGNVLVLAASLASVLLHVSPSLAGLSIGYALSVTGVMTWAVRQAAETENQMNAVERLHYYASQLPSEPSWDTLISLPADWLRGKKSAEDEEEYIHLQHVSLRYRSELPPSLIDLSICIPKGKKVAIIGRTGSGKSTIMMALFRLVDPFEGSIILQGIDIQTVGLRDLRRRLAIIPQDAALFSGTIRSNLDPFNEHTDQEIWDILERSFLKQLVSSLPDRLDAAVDENGDNFSVGQRQLFCLARAMLRHASILVLDEATASVDMKTDALIQESLRRDFHGVTILTIAHRLSTVADYDMLIIMENGRAKVEYNPKVFFEAQRQYAP